MKAMVLNCRRVLLVAIFLYGALTSIAQKKRKIAPADRKDFYHLVADANLKFTYPPGFRAIPAINDEDFSFDFALELPAQDFEMWVQVNPQKQNWNSYLHTRYNEKTKQENPDSVFVKLGKADAIALSGDDSYLERYMPRNVLARYNADAGRSYLLDLLDLHQTGHYKYALIIALQQNHNGTLVAICFTNQKDADFYKAVNRACRSFRFKPVRAVD
jgi:hypothetical protein